MLVFFKYFFIVISIQIIVTILLIIASKIEIKVENFNVCNIKNEKNNKNFFVVLSLKILNIPWLKIKINKYKMANSYVKEKIKVEKNNINVNKEFKNILKICIDNKKIKEEFKKVKIRLEKLNMNANIGLKDCVLTSYLVGGIAIVMSNILPHVANKNFRNYKYSIAPIYKNKNLYKINLNCIITARIVHIIYIIFLIKKEKKRSSDKNERTSNRKSYEYSYE